MYKSNLFYFLSPHSYKAAKVGGGVLLKEKNVNKTVILSYNETIIILDIEDAAGIKGLVEPYFSQGNNFCHL